MMVKPIASPWDGYILKRGNTVRVKIYDITVPDSVFVIVSSALCFLVCIVYPSLYLVLSQEIHRPLHNQMPTWRL